MKTPDRVLDTLLIIVQNISNPRVKFIKELFAVLLSIQGKGNFTNFVRYSRYNESSF